MSTLSLYNKKYFISFDFLVVVFYWNFEKLKSKIAILKRKDYIKFTSLTKKAHDAILYIESK